MYRMKVLYSQKGMGIRKSHQVREKAGWLFQSYFHLGDGRALSGGLGDC